MQTPFDHQLAVMQMIKTFDIDDVKRPGAWKRPS